MESLYGETGWKQLQHHIGICVARQWCRLARMNESRLNRKVFVWSVGKNNWMVNVRSYFQKINIEYILDIDSDRDLKAIMTELDMALSQYYEQQWHEKCQRQHPIRGSGQNKLRIYRQFKFSSQAKQYLKFVMPKKYRSAMAKMRTGVAPIRIETGHYEGLP